MIQASYDSLMSVLPELREDRVKMRTERAQQLANLRESKVQGESDYVEVAIQRGALAALADIDEALDRIDAGIYGACSSCGGEISPARLQFRPMAVNCADCQSRLERASA